MKTHWAKATRALTLMAVPFLLPASVTAQAAGSQVPAGQAAPGAPSASELAKQTQNPIASLISFPIQGDMGVGDRDATSTLVNVQPVIPFPISKSTNVVLRLITPLTSQPAQMAFASALTRNERTDVAYSMTYPTGTIMKIVLLQVMLAVMRQP